MEFDLSDIKLSKYDKERGVLLPSKITEDLAYLCGILAGDGYIARVTDKKHKYNIICCGNPTDEKEYYYKVIIPLFFKLFNIKIIPKFGCDGTIKIRIGSKGIHDLLVDLIGLPTGRKYDSLRIPKLFLDDERLVISFIRGVFDTDGSICFKKRYRNYHYYPVISLSSRSCNFIKEISDVLKNLGFKVVETYNYQVRDNRFKSGFSIINRIELNGKYNLNIWEEKIGFSSPKHINKIKNNAAVVIPQPIARGGFEFGRNS